MRERRHFVALDEYEHGIVIDSLNEKRNDLRSEGKSTDAVDELIVKVCLLYTSPSPRDRSLSRMPSSA